MPARPGGAGYILSTTFTSHALYDRMLYELVLQYLDTRVALRHAMAAKAALLLGLFCPTQSSNGVDPCTALVDWHSEADAGCDLFLAAGATCESAWNEICGEDNPAGAEYNSWSLSSSGCSQCATTCSGPHLSDPEALCHVWLEAGATCDSTSP